MGKMKRYTVAYAQVVRRVEGQVRPGRVEVNPWTEPWVTPPPPKRKVVKEESAIVVRGFPSCCGAATISDFWTVDHDVGRLDPEVVREKVSSILNSSLYTNMGFFLAILREDQDKRFGNVLLELGFDMVSKGINPGHESTLKVYCYTKRKEG
jgi:hypothetical protein